jgi:hypothetical protein
MADTTFSAEQIVGKTLTASKKVSVYSDPTDTEQPFGYVNAGQPIGVVYSWLDANAASGRSGLWWAFINSNTNSWYYTPHVAGNFSVSDLKAQGAITVQDATDKAAYDAMPWYEQMISKYGKWLVIVPVVGIVATPLINNLFKSRSNAQ